MNVTASSSRRGRYTAIALLCSTVIGVAAWAVSYGPGYIRVRHYAERVRKGVNSGGNLDALAEVDHPEAIRVLEKYASNPTPALAKGRALKLLCRYFPESKMPRGVRDYEAITGKSYGVSPRNRNASHRNSGAMQIPRDQVSAFRGWLDRYPVHPGRDDALLRMGIELQSSSPREALELLYRGFHEPDGDKHDLIAKYFQRVLERHASEVDILGLLQGPADTTVGDNLLYVAGLKRMRLFDFGAALEFFDASVKARGAAPFEMRARFRRIAYRISGSWQRAKIQDEHRQKIVPNIDRQITACRWFRAKMSAYEKARDEELRAGLLHEIARRCFKDADLFVNHTYYEFPLDESIPRRGQITLEDVHESNHYRQAAMVFKKIVRDYPCYSHLAEVEYSIPLCAWRLRRAWSHRIWNRINEEIWRGFQEFAEKYPASSMADDALYIAGKHHYTPGGSKDAPMMQDNAKRIVRDYADGDILLSEAKRNYFLKQALAERDAAEQ